MHLSIAATLLACTSGVQAFVDSSPFILFSTSALAPTSNSAQLQTSAQVLASAKELLSSCPTDRYFLVSQPNLHAADIRRANGPNGQCRTRNLCGVAQNKKGELSKTIYSVAEVIGQVSGQSLKEHIQTACRAKGREAQIDRVELRHLPAAGEDDESEERRILLEDNDMELGKLLDVLDEYTIIMFSDPNEFKPYQSDFSGEEPVHMDLKRWSESEFLSRRDGNSTHKPLFEKYQFFTPGIFMALIVILIILSILGVGLRALASLEVSYGAFDKEMGPAAQKKQM
ncbi:hypothetical protein QBC42DRAFT_202024 [Cladorrhinum samala]|uniref:Protein BIG1 n=1 Tax=Cladorrhinum samala TaxID=585594 RepID=A0AAV9HQM0_9PEZI|nr:hypothetical protein QBC42DRAFT_202024 [Cladorrhinum samala]